MLIGQLAALVSWLVEIVHVEGSIVPAGLADEDGQVPAVAGVRARDDQLVVDGREAAAAHSFGVATHERYFACFAQPVPDNASN